MRSLRKTVLNPKLPVTVDEFGQLMFFRCVRGCKTSQSPTVQPGIRNMASWLHEYSLRAPWEYWRDTFDIWQSWI